MDEIYNSTNNLRNKAISVFQYLFIIVSGFIGIFLSKYLAGDIMLNLSAMQATVIIACVIYLMLILLHRLSVCVLGDEVRTKCRPPRYTVPLDTNYKGINEIKVIEIIKTQASIDKNKQVLVESGKKIKYTFIEVFIIAFVALICLIF